MATTGKLTAQHFAAAECLVPSGLLVVELMLEHSSSVYTGLSAYRLKPEPFFDAKDFALNGNAGAVVAYSVAVVLVAVW